MASINIRPRVGRIRIGRNTPNAAISRDVRDQFKDIQNNLNEVLAEIKDATPEALEDALRPIFERSQELCPKDTGRLVESGFLEVTQQGEVVQAEIGYAKGGDPEYAVFVHEDLEAQHNPPTQAKWLEAAIDEKFDGVRAVLVATYSRMFG